MKRVEAVEDGLKMKRVTSPKAVGEFWEGQAVAKENVFYVGIVERREEIKDGIDLLHAFPDDVTRIGNVSHRCAEKRKAVGGGGRDATLERVAIVWRRVSAPNLGLGRVESMAKLLFEERLRNVFYCRRGLKANQ